MNRFIYYISRAIQVQNRRDRDRIVVDDIEEEVLVDVEYDEKTQVFELARYDSTSQDDQIDTNWRNNDR